MTTSRTSTKMLELTVRSSFQGALVISIPAPSAVSGSDSFGLHCAKAPPPRSSSPQLVFDKSQGVFTWTVSPSEGVLPRAHALIDSLPGQLMPERTERIDGIYYTLRIESGRKAVTHEWSGRPPAEWQSSQDLADLLVQESCVDTHFPAPELSGRSWEEVAELAARAGATAERRRRWPYPHEVYSRHFASALSNMGLLADIGPDETRGTKDQ
jgi:hypothetical protein